MQFQIILFAVSLAHSAFAGPVPLSSCRNVLKELSKLTLAACTVCYGEYVCLDRLVEISKIKHGGDNDAEEGSSDGDSEEIPSIGSLENSSQMKGIEEPERTKPPLMRAAELYRAAADGKASNSKS